MSNSTWRKLIAEEMAEHGDSFANVLFSTLTHEELDVEFYAGYGSSKGKPFTLWTETRVYFPVVYDGEEWCGSASRDYDGVPTKHVGGE